MHNKHWKSRMVAAAAFITLSAGMALAQNGYGNHGQYDDQHWGHGPDGYADAYHEQDGRPMLGARQGWAAGQAQGQSDRQQGHSYRPTHVDTFKHVPDSPGGYPRDQFKQEYRDAFMKGYARGYGR